MTPASAPVFTIPAEPVIEHRQAQQPREGTFRPVPLPTTIAGGGPKQAWSPTLTPGTRSHRRILTIIIGLAASIPALCFVVWLLTTFRFSSLMSLALVVIILINLIKLAAGFSGRKTTTMADPDKPDIWHR